LSGGNVDTTEIVLRMCLQASRDGLDETIIGIRRAMEETCQYAKIGKNETTAKTP